MFDRKKELSLVLYSFVWFW